MAVTCAGYLSTLQISYLEEDEIKHNARKMTLNWKYNQVKESLPLSAFCKQPVLSSQLPALVQ